MHSQQARLENSFEVRSPKAIVALVTEISSGFHLVRAFSSSEESQPPWKKFHGERKVIRKTNGCDWIKILDKV
jgi:hypothetical protein